MKHYEVTREIFNVCAGKYEIDLRFPDEVITDDVFETMKNFYSGNLPEYEVKTDKNGVIVYTVSAEPKERYTFSEF